MKSALRKLAIPIADAATFNTIIQSVILSNQFACVAYMTAGESDPAAEKRKEAYTVQLVYQNSNAKSVGTATTRLTRLPDQCRGDHAASASAVSTAHGGTVAQDAGKDAFCATLKCLDANGELYRELLLTLTYPHPFIDRSFDMSTFGNFILNQEYADLAARGGDPLQGISSMIDWERFHPLQALAYQSNTELGGHPHTNVIQVMKLLFLQQ
ncbi:hypothetical protein [Methanosphaerula palustris]|uniref:hypothetical protein n=1 Tax=Methanosphaerula palustris TaxID=475088 RepID=UPI0001848F63